MSLFLFLIVNYDINSNPLGNDILVYSKWYKNNVTMNLHMYLLL